MKNIYGFFFFLALFLELSHAVIKKSDLFQCEEIYDYEGSLEDYISFQEFLQLLKELRVYSTSDFAKLKREGLPDGIPSQPLRVYSELEGQWSVLWDKIHELRLADPEEQQNITEHRKITSVEFRIFMADVTNALEQETTAVEETEILNEKNVAEIEDGETDRMSSSFESETWLWRHFSSDFLSKEREEELITEWQETENNAALSEILSSHIKLIRRYARQVSNDWKSPDFFQDLMSEAMLLIQKQLKNHDIKKGRLSSYLRSWLPFALHKIMYDYISPVAIDQKGRKEEKAPPSTVSLSDSSWDVEVPEDDTSFHQTYLFERMKWLDKLIEQIGFTPRQRYILRFRIFKETQDQETALSIAKKFGVSDQTIFREEKQLLKRIWEHLGSNPSVSYANKAQVALEAGRLSGEGVPVSIENETQTDESSIKKLIALLKLNEIQQYILRHRFLKASHEQQTFAAIGRVFDVTKEHVQYQQRTLLKVLEDAARLTPAILLSPEIIALSERIKQKWQQRKQSIPVLDVNQIVKKWNDWIQQLNLNKIQQYILEHRLLKDPRERMSLPDIGKAFGLTESPVKRWEQILLDKLQKEGLVSFTLKSPE